MRYPELAQEIARRLKKVIKERNVTVCQFATDCQIDASVMYDIINAKHNLMDYVLLKIVANGKVDCKELFDGLEKFMIDAPEGKKGK